tara:strand:+ start:370 stop:561 length:192 start_codon:yes stop_codon:yes gene_type:complete
LGLLLLSQYYRYFKIAGHDFILCKSTEKIFVESVKAEIDFKNIVFQNPYSLKTYLVLVETKDL